MSSRKFTKAALWIGTTIAATYIFFGGGILGYRICLNKPSIMTPTEEFDQYAEALLNDIDLGRNRHHYKDRARYRARVVQLMDIYRRDCLSKVFHGDCRVIILDFGSLAWTPDPYEYAYSFNRQLVISVQFDDSQDFFSGVPEGGACRFNGEFFFD